MESQEGQKAPPAEKDPKRKILAVIVAAIVVCGALIGYVLYSESGASKAQSSSAIVSGDVVMMNYIGKLPDGRVFDTSLYSVASNDARYPKSLTFSLRDNSSYKPFNMTAGNYGTGGTIKGFALGVLGLREGDRATITVLPGEGYKIQSNFTRWQELSQLVPAVEVVSTQEFSNNFKTTPVPMAILPHYFWTWDVQVVEVFAGTVTYRNIPTVGEVIYPFGDPSDPTNPSGWPVEVTEFDPLDAVITVKHHLTADDVYNVKGTDIDDRTIIVTDYNAENGTFQVGKSNSSSGYNAEIAGRTLIFEVTIITVTRAE
jgi:FKBP-type peptidyl-prolyl cis-trans isomerase 2